MANRVDIHNQVRQSDIALEDVWKTRCGYFRMFTTILGINITDAWLTYKWHVPSRHYHKNISAKDFMRMLVRDLLEDNNLPRLSSADHSLTLPPIPGKRPAAAAASAAVASVPEECVINTRGEDTLRGEGLTQDSAIRSESNEEDESASSNDSNDGEEGELTQRRQHELVKTDAKEPETKYKYGNDGRMRSKKTTFRRRRRKCWFCGVHTSHYCPDCPPPDRAEWLWVCSGKECCKEAHLDFAEENASDGEQKGSHHWF